MKKNFYKTLFVIIVIMTLIMTDFILVGQHIAIAMYDELEAQNKSTNVKNVEFDAYFLNNGEKMHHKQNNIDEEEILILSINVKEKGILNEAKIKIENSNFSIVKDKVKNDYVKNINIENNEIELNQIIYQNNITIELPITFKKQDTFADDYFEKENTISITGIYNDTKDIEVFGQVKTRMVWKQQTDVDLNQSIEKYIDLGEDGILLQQNIITDVIDNKLPRENETLKVQVPLLDEKAPKSVIVLLNGNKMTDENTIYNQDDESVEIRNANKGFWGKSKNEYKIIYLYSGEIEFTTKEATLNTSMITKLYTQDSITKQDEKTGKINPTGNIASISKTATESIYKGFMYAGVSNDTAFEENNQIEISNINKIEKIEIQKEKEEFLDEAGKIFDNSKNILYQSTKINKNNFINLFGTEGKIEIKDSYDQIIETIDNNTKEDENGNIVISYPNKIEDIKIITSKPINEGTLSVINTRAIQGEIGYTKEQLRTFTKIISKTKVKTNLSEEVAQAEITLNDTKTEANLKISNDNLSTLQNNENLQFLITLKSDDFQYDLYKNPQLEIVLPKELKAKIKNISQMNRQDELTIVNPKIYMNENGEQVISLQMQGEQLTFENTINQGIQVVISADIEVDKNTPSKDVLITMNYTNENRKQENFTTTLPVHLNSKYGVLVTNEVTGYNAKNEVISGIDNNIITGSLDSNSEQRNVIQNINIINNYENEIYDTYVIGKIPEIEEERINDTVLKSTFKTNLLNSIITNGKEATIYYSEDSNATAESTSWKQNYDEVDNPKTFKIELGTLKAGETAQINYQVSIPANLDLNEETYIKNTVNYGLLGGNNSSISAVKLETDVKDENNKETEELSKTEEDKEISLEITALTGNEYLKDGDTVKEGQGITYELKITNNTEQTLNNINIQATNTNAIYYDTITYQDNINGEMMDLIKIDENLELTSKELKIDELKTGETKSVKYQISVKEVEGENQKLTGEIKLKSDELEEKTFTNIENVIEQAELKLTLRNAYSEDIDIYSSGYRFPITMNIENITNVEMKDVIIEIPVSNGLSFSVEDFYVEDNAKYEFVDYNDKNIRIKIKEIQAKEKISITTALLTEDLEINLDKVLILEYFKAIANEKVYLSNNIEKIIYQAKTIINAEQTSNIEGDTVKDGDNIIFNIHISNQGAIAKEILVNDFLSAELKIREVYILKNQEKEMKKEYDGLVTERIELEPNESIDLVIDTILDTSLTYEKTISNYATINGNRVDIKTNVLEYKIERKEDNSDSDDSENQEGEDSDNDGSDEKEEKTGSISGQVWIDENRNGTKDSNEAKIENLSVMLIDENTGTIAKDISNNSLMTTTDGSGKYSFKDLNSGKYIVLFKYDTNKYTVTEYKKAGVSETVNSDIVIKTINLDNKEVTLGTTETLEINSNELSDIDAGLIEGKVFDFKLDKYISSVIIQNKKGTEKRSYDNQNLAKIEIDAKYISGSNIIIEYQLNVTNEGEVAGYANEIKDYLPKDLKFSSELNKDWYQTTDGYICTKALENTNINPGETKTITLVLTKQMTQNNTGTIINIAEINKQSNDYALEDIDSTAGNKKDGEDDISQAELIISIRTGTIVLYLTLAFTIILIIGVGIYLIRKKVFNKNI